MTPLAESLGVSRRFGPLLAVDGVDLRIGPGEVVGLLGANGAGKTTLIRLLLGLLPPSAGAVRLFGEPPSRRARRRVGYVPQGLGLYEDLTPRENVAFASAVFGGGAGELPEDLGPLADVPVGQLPLGIQRRVAFALALAHRPELLFLDEPTSGVDPLARARLWEQIRAAAEAGAGVLVTTHHMEEAEECDRLAVMAEGRVVAEGSLAEIVEAAGLPAALGGRALRVPRASREAVERALGDLPVRLSAAPATLEERFLELALGRAAA